MNETLRLDNLFCNPSSRSLFVSLADLIQKAGRAGCENLAVLCEHAGENRIVEERVRATQPAAVPFLPSWDWYKREVSKLTSTRQPLRKLASAVTDTTSLASHHGTFSLPALAAPQLLTDFQPQLSQWFLVDNAIVWHYLTAPSLHGREPLHAPDAAWKGFPGSYSETAITVRGHVIEPCEVPTEVSQSGQAARSEGAESLRDAFAAAFRVDPERAVDSLVELVKTRRNGGLVAARVFLPYLVQASYAQQNLFLDAVLRTSSPDDVLRAALLLSDGGAGEAVLEIAANVLENFGERSWPALAKLAASKDSRCRHFVRAIAYVPTADLQAKVKALVALAKNPDLDTRWLVANVAEEVSSEAASAVWKALCADSDEQLRATAEAQTASLIA